MKLFLSDQNCAVNLLEDPVVGALAIKHGKSPAQILLRFLIHLGVSVIPKSFNRERLCQNIEMFNFELELEDLLQLEKLDRGEEGRSVRPDKR